MMWYDARWSEVCLQENDDLKDSESKHALKVKQNPCMFKLHINWSNVYTEQYENV